MHLKHFLSLACFLNVVSTSAYAQQQPNQALADKALAVLEKRCYRCHGGPAGTNAELDVLSQASLLQPRGSGDIAEAFIIPGKPDESLLWQAMDGDDAFMPLSGSAEQKAIAPQERDLIKQWIDAGAPMPKRRKVQTLTTTDVLGAMFEHLKQVPVDQRRTIRFFRMDHLHNNPEVSDRELRIHRAALAKVVNSLLWRKRSFVDVETVEGTHDSVYAVDISELDWDQDDLWRTVLGENPYGLHYKEANEEDLREAATELALNTGIDVPYVRLDWFVVYATQDPLYRKLMDIPRTTRELEERLGVDFASNFRRGKLARAGFTRSGVSRQNRMVERHEARDGAYWVSYDFKPLKGRGDLIRFPLGPEFEGNPFNRFAFDHDGGEIIYSLPNGLQGYMLTDGEGVRFDAAGPIEVVFDSSGFMGTPQIVNGISCIHCHKHGMITRFRDDVRDSDALLGAMGQKVRELYVEHETMQRHLEEDRQRFMTALERVTGPFLKVGPDAEKPITEFPEPVGKVAERYYTDMGLAETAHELGLKPQQFQASIRRNPRLQRLGLGILIEKQPSKLKRDKWEARELTSLFQDVARQVHPGVTPSVSLN